MAQGLAGFPGRNFPWRRSSRLLAALAAFGAVERGSADGSSPEVGTVLQREQPPVLDPYHFRHLEDPDVPDPELVSDHLGALGIPAIDPRVAALRCSVAGLLRMGIEDMDLHSANFDAAAGSYSYELLGDSDIDPEDASLIRQVCVILKRVYLGLAAAAVEQGNACVTLAGGGAEDANCGGALVASVAQIRRQLSTKVEEALGQTGAQGGDAVLLAEVTNSTGSVLARHASVFVAMLSEWEASVGGIHADASVSPGGLVRLVGLAGRQLKNFADNIAQALGLNLLPRMNPDNAAFQAVVSAVSSVGWPRFVYSDLYGHRWHVLSLLLRQLAEEGGAEHPSLRVAEVGVEKGQTLLYLVSRASLPIVEYVGIDPYYSEEKPTLNEVLDGYRRNLSATISAKHGSVARLELQSSQDAVSAFEDGQFDLIFIDADHEFLPAKRDLSAWRRKVRPGGILAGHDFSMHHISVVLAVSWECGEMHTRTVNLGSDTTWWCRV
ncbi:unnamed protein product [Polarella glacialis]|uniref:Uncharacterized protein n=1 Tax=Polarella glacialis TaxID=89957 RepID=A0A813DG31_POLGL|nr:unnamed protein product [Polarella glacialis]CAE8720387.1 unnamed protein product [Polarella glacialis]